ncbi:Uncharacterised protein [Urinicoccus massiliensis]|uniref:Uncharacterized protein n=1 Tax=Urinicoccus massiliensis TaxID=1723382 RepID=A0A8H2M720_9FIRM|nr:hypothetical protein [Urinicoccus massiliensis]VFB16011.1 Uncharacterised protein [Urinicoccus massiliensis]
MKKFLSYLQGVALVGLGLILVGSPIYGQDNPIFKIDIFKTR